MNRQLSLLAFAIPALLLFLAAAWMVLGGHRPTPGAAPSSAITMGGTSLKSTSIMLPANEPSLPGGPATEIVTNNCTACHSVEMITMQPPLDAKTWGAEITKMRSVYHARIDEKDDPALVKALMGLPSQQPR